MPPRPAGRPKAAHPKDVRVTVRFTEQEADMLQRLAGQDSLAATIRGCVLQVLQRRRQGTLPDTEQARLRRELRKARRAATPESAALEPLFTLDEPAADEQVQEVRLIALNDPATVQVQEVRVVVQAPPAADEQTEDVPVLDQRTGQTGIIRVTKRQVT